MIGISIRANWDFESTISSLYNVGIDFFEIQLDNSVFKIPELRSRAIELINKSISKKMLLAFHLSFIDVNIATLDSKIRSSTSKLLKKEMKFIKRWNPLYIVLHSGKVSETFIENRDIKEKAQHQQQLTIFELLKTTRFSSIPLAIENRQKSKTPGLIQNIEDINNYKKLFPSLYFVLDLGHLNTFHGNPESFLETFKSIRNLPIIAFHLSNNFGKDSHGTLEKGSIPFIKLFNNYSYLKERLLVIENRKIEETLQSLSFLRKIVIQNKLTNEKNRN